MGGSSDILCLAALAAWVLGASLIGGLRTSLRARAQVAAVVAGVPLLGWLTYENGPGIGVGAFVLGLALLARAPSRRRSRAGGMPGGRVAPGRGPREGRGALSGPGG